MRAQPERALRDRATLAARRVAQRAAIRPPMVPVGQHE